MQRKYRTSHLGIAAYLVTKGYQIVRFERGQNRSGYECTYMEFDIDQYGGKQMGDAFFDGGVHGNLKEFYEALGNVRKQRMEASK